MLLLVIPEIWIELHEAVNSRNVEKTTNVIEKHKTLNSLKQEMNILSNAQENLEGNGTHCNSSKDNSGIDQQIDIEKDTSMSCEKLEDTTEYLCVQDMINQRFETYNETILHLASRLGQADIVKILLEAGANPTLK